MSNAKDSGGPATSIARTAATGGALDAEFLQWSTSLPYDIRLLEQDCRGSVAHVQALAADTDVLDQLDQLNETLESLRRRLARLGGEMKR